MEINTLIKTNINYTHKGPCWVNGIVQITYSFWICVKRTITIMNFTPLDLEVETSVAWV
jgi:hypothetical protein